MDQAALKIEHDAELSPTPSSVAASTLAEPASATADLNPKRRRRRGKSRPLVRVWLPDLEEPPPSARPSALEHAQRLLDWLQSDPAVAGHCVLAADLARIYPTLCGELNWSPRPWNTVAKHLRRLTGGRKHYRWVDGRRLCAYPIPMRAT
jgi:hypothetical protein